jgi:Protein of unknown function (DUF2946)
LLRRLPRLSRWVLLWFVLYIAGGVVAPWMQPVSLGSICSAGGMVLSVQDLAGVDDPEQTPGMGKMLQCPACSIVTLGLPMAAASSAVQRSPLSYALSPLREAHLAYATAPPLPSRGPPPPAS